MWVIIKKKNYGPVLLCFPNTVFYFLKLENKKKNSDSIILINNFKIRKTEYSFKK